MKKFFLNYPQSKAADASKNYIPSMSYRSHVSMNRCRTLSVRQHDNLDGSVIVRLFGIFEEKLGEYAFDDKYFGVRIGTIGDIGTMAAVFTEQNIFDGITTAFGSVGKNVHK